MTKKYTDSNKLILGASGFLGNYLLREFNNASYHTTSSNDSKFNLKTTFETHKDIKKILSKFKYNQIFNTIAMTDIELCEKNKDLAVWLNSDLPGLFANECFKKNIKFIHFSTDAVFDGRKAMATEKDHPNPISFYGKSKLFGETKVVENNNKSLILRVNFFGLSKKSSLFNFFYDAGLKNKEIIGFTDVYFTTLYAGDLAKITKKLASDNSQGLFHVVGNQRLNKFDFGKLIYKEFEFNSMFLAPGSINNSSTLMKNIRSLDLSLCNDKLLESGIKVPTIATGLKTIKKEVKNYDKK